MTLTDQIVKNIITRLINSQDYRIEIVNLINAEFLQFSIGFFKEIVTAKLNSEDITIEWYKHHFMSSTLKPEDIAINSGLNKKTISNMYGTAKREIIIDASNEHFETLYQSIQSLVEIENDIDLNLTIKLNNVSVELNISESLIVINTLAVKRSQLRGGLWSTAGKRAEKYLMLTLCRLFSVPSENYDSTVFVKDRNKKVDREIDFYLLGEDQRLLCEVKLMGKGNPESADAIIARDTNIFVADTLSQQNKNQCDQLNINWVSLREDNGYKKFEEILEIYNIPHESYNGDLETDLPIILDDLFQ